MCSTLHRRAFAWHRDNGLVDQAIEHALKADAFAEAGDLIATTWIDHVNVGRHATVLAWLERFPRELLREDPQLLLVQAWVLSLYGGREAAADAIAALERLGPLEAGPLPDGFSSLEASLATLRAAIPWGDFGAGLENAHRAAELEGPTSRWRALVCCSLGGCLYFSGQFDEADRWLAEATELALAHEQWLVAADALARRSLVAAELGRVDEQALFAGEAVKLAQERGLEEVEADVVRRRSAHRSKRRGSSRRRCRRSSGPPRSSVPRVIRRSSPYALIRQAALLRAMDRREAAAAVIEEARATVDSCADPRMLAEWLAALERPRTDATTKRRRGAQRA